MLRGAPVSAKYTPDSPVRGRVYGYGLPFEILVRSMASAAADRAACLASASDLYWFSAPCATGTRCTESRNAVCDVQSPSACFTVVTMIRRP